MTACCNLAMPIPRQKAAEAAAETTSAAISVQHLQMSFGTHQVLRDVDFTVRQGDVISIIGPSGSGKSTSYNKVTVQGAAASRVFFHLKAEAVRMGE